MSFFEEYPFFIPFLSVIIAFSGVITTWYIFRKTARSKAVADRHEAAAERESLARQKMKDEVELAKELKMEAAASAAATKEMIKEYILNRIESIKQDLILQKEMLMSEVSLLRKDTETTRRDLEKNIEQQQVINTRMQKSIDFMNQFLWGAGAKSMPPFTQGEEESQEHKDKPTVGIFTEPDSSETKEEKNNAAAAGKPSTITDDIAKAREKEGEEDSL